MYADIYIYTTMYIISFPGDSMAKNLPANAGDARLVPWSGRSLGKGSANPLQYSCLGNPMNRGAWGATVHEVTKSRTRLSPHTHTYKTDN